MKTVLGVMKTLAIVVLAVSGLLVTAVGALYIYASSDYTDCYAIFQSRAAAERAADEADKIGFVPDVDHRRSESAVTFHSGESGADAQERRRVFGDFVRRHEGTLGHPGDGCLERKPFEH